MGMVVADIGCGGGYFTVELANLVGPQGRVMAIDLQPEMLAFTRAYAEKKGVLERVVLHQCKPDTLNLSGEKVDFALAFYVVHEVRDHSRLFREIYAFLNPDGKLLVCEPSFHETGQESAKMIEVAKTTGLCPVREPRLLLSRGMLFGI